MRRQTACATALVLIGLLSSIQPAAAGELRGDASTGFPRFKDPQSWTVPEEMTWGDYRDVPGTDWRDPGYEAPKTLRAALILGDFQDQGFRVSETSVDATGQKGLGVADPAKYWLDVLFKVTSPTTPQRGHTVGEYWLENSYGLIDVDAEAFGPYTMDGKMHEYGIADFASDEDCPPESSCNKDINVDLTAASAADVTASQQEHGQFDFRFLLHAGYDESGVWLNYGQALFAGKDLVTDAFGPPEPDQRNWAETRYVDWTSWFSAQQIWSRALPGALALEGESDGGSVYAHELSHVLGVLDNYNNPYADNPRRSYSGPWDMMSRGTFNGPGGPFERFTIPPSEGATMGAHHMLRNKIRLGFIPPSEAFTVTREALNATGIIKARILQRESPPAIEDPDLHSGIRITLGQDLSDCDSSNPKCDGGGYDSYDVEVVNRQGFDSFIPDHGVLIAKSKAADASPFIWVQDAFPRNLKKVDYVRADGKKFFYTVGDYRQLADAAFHAGSAPGTRNSFVDRENSLAFYILKKKNSDGRLIYTVAVESLTAPGAPTEGVVTKKRGRLVTGQVRRQVFTVTNEGLRDTVFELKVRRKGVRTKLLNDLVFVPAGGTKRFSVWAQKNAPKASLKVIARHI